MPTRDKDAKGRDTAIVVPAAIGQIVVTILRLNRRAGVLLRDQQHYDPWALRWVDPGADAPPPTGERISPVAAMRWLNTTAGARRVPIGVIGPNRARQHHVEIGEQLGKVLAQLGFVVLTGGRTGVMDAASRGAHQAGGLTIALLPGADWQEANQSVAIPLATGIGEARNALIARAAAALIAVGGEYGTLSEMALGLHFSRPVFSLAEAPSVPGAVLCESVDEAIERLCAKLLDVETKGIAAPATDG